MLQGIINKTTTPFSPLSDNVAKYEKQTFKETMNAMLISLGMPRTCARKLSFRRMFIFNKIPQKKKDKTLYE